jgi:Family of unknown function (DUF5995)
MAVQIKLIQKSGLIFVALLITVFYCRAQYNIGTKEVLVKLDSIRNSSSVSKHFAGIYFVTTIRAIRFFSKADTNVQHLADRLEKRFAYYFFRSVYAHENNSDIPNEWKTYYADKGSPMLRYILFGINAHINGDIWQALTAEFSLEEIRQLKPAYFLYQKDLVENYKTIYQLAIESNPRIKLLHSLSFGLDKIYGKIMLHRWRKKQIKLAELYYTDRKLFEKKLDKVHRNMDRINERIRRNI